MDNRKYAFTLAEVLITLVIVGVIAALTIPTLMKNMHNHEYVAALKKTYAALSQATQLIISENGSPKGDSSWLTDMDSIYDMYKKHLINAKDCGEGACEGDDKYYLTYLNGTKVGTNWFGVTRSHRKLILSDGAFLIFESTDKTCSINNYVGNGSKDVCAKIYADVNGAKKPNQHGRDIFGFVLKANGLYPAGCDYPSNCDVKHIGFDCACKVLRENAINY